MRDTLIAQELVILRSKCGWTQQQFAKKVNVTQRTIAAWEAGTSVPRKSMRVKLAQVFDLPEDYFLDAAPESEEDARDPSETEELEKKLYQVLSQYGETISEQKKSILMETFRQMLK